MKIPDVNLLVYARNEAASQHRAARGWIEEVLSGTESVGFPWLALLGFIRISTHPKIFSQPLTPKQALALVDLWLAQPCATIIQPTPRHASVLRDLIGHLGTAGNLTTDAHLAALAIEHGAQLCSADVDFSRFPSLNWHNPLAG